MEREKEVELMSSTVIQEIKRVSYRPVNMSGKIKSEGKIEWVKIIITIIIILMMEEMEISRSF